MTTLEDAAVKCGVTLDLQGSGPEVRLDCPFRCPGDHCGRREVAVNTSNPQKVFQCHSYQCGFRGNLLTLMHGWLTGSRPEGDKLKGNEFHRVKDILAGNVVAPASTEHPASKPASDSPPPVPERNVPLIESPDAKIRDLATLDEKFIVDVAHMPPATANYVRHHPCLSPESMRKWRVGVLPMDGGGDKRGISLRGCAIYPLLSEEGQVLAWIGRDPKYEEKERDFARLTPAERASATPPMKHRFPKGIHRGLELFGQHASRLQEPQIRESLQSVGLVVVEGPNDVMRLDAYGVAAVGLCSNRATDQQVEKLARFARKAAYGRLVLLPDNDPEGEAGCKDLLWRLSQCEDVRVKLGWSSSMLGGMFAGRQPESLTFEECDLIRKRATE